MKNLYVKAGRVVAVTYAANASVIIEPDPELVAGTDKYQVPAGHPAQVGWLLDVDQDGDQVPFVAPPPVPPTIGPNEFHFLWTIHEQVAIEQLRQDDLAVKLFMRRLDDPRTKEVVLADPAVQQAVRHTVEQLAAMGVIEAAAVASRGDAIVAGRKP